MNRSKGAKDAAPWPVAVASGDCEGPTPTRGACDQFVAVTIAVKHTWGLSVDAAEDAALRLDAAICPTPSPTRAVLPATMACRLAPDHAPIGTRAAPDTPASAP